MKKTKDLEINYEISGTCPYCGSYFSINLGPEKPVEGDDLTCGDCGKEFLLGLT